MINFKTIDRASVKTEALLILHDLDQKFFPQPWNEFSWTEIFSTTSERLIITILNDDEILGFVLFEISFVDSFAHLLKILIKPDMRHKGSGLQLMNQGLEALKKQQIKTVFLEVEENNLAAIGLYERIGFKTIHKKNHFYSNGATALIMTLE